MERDGSSLSRLRWQLSSLRVQAAMLRLSISLKAGFRPEQPRVPRGSGREGGRWTRIPGYAQVHQVSRRRGGGGQIRIGGRWLPITPAQEALLAQSYGAMRGALRDVRQVDPNWKPPAQLYATPDGLIAANRAIEREALKRIDQLRQQGIGLGKYVIETLPARNSARLFTWEERQAINRMGQKYGCHTCGTRIPGTRSGSFVIDHQLPSARNPAGQSQKLVPHCLPCSLRQGGFVKGLQGRRTD